MVEKRIQWIDWVKGVVIILVIYGHVCRGFMAANMFNNINLKYIDFTIYSFHMPLMFLITGMVYNNSREILSKRDYIRFIRKKVLSLYIPYLIFSYLQFFIKFTMGNMANSSTDLRTLYTIPFKPYDIYWFLLNLLLIFIFYSFLDYKIKNGKIILAIALIIFFISITIKFNYSYISTIIVYLGNGFYFYLGKIIYKKNIFIKKIYAISSIILYLIVNLMAFKSRNSNIIIILTLVLLMAYAVIFISKNIKYGFFSRLLIYIGKNSMCIYVLHTIFTAFLRIILNKLNINNFIIQSILGILGGVIFPLIIFSISNKYKIFRGINWCFNPSKKI